MGTRARLTLRADVKFHDGAALTAGDVAASLGHSLKQPGGWMLAPIVAARAVSEQVVELQLSRPAPDLPLLLSTPASAVILPGGAPRAKPVGSGPFAVDKIDHGTVALRAFAEHFAGRPYLDHLVLRAFASRTEEAGAYEIGALMASRHGVSAFEGGAPRHAGTVTDGPPGITVFLAIGPKISAELAGPLAGRADGGHRSRALAAAGGCACRRRCQRPIWPRDAARRRGAPAPRPVRRTRRASSIARWPTACWRSWRAWAWTRRSSWSRSRSITRGARAANTTSCSARRCRPRPTPAWPSWRCWRRSIRRRREPSWRALPAAAGAVKLDGARLVPLIRRGARISHLAELRGVTVDGAARVDWADVPPHTKSRAASE